ncbi:uncharacterized protein TEOVI_000881500 [Trypanosoma equiperdum]|uniref:Trypanosomal VSG domain containing protein n=1 Tax=Trypanosoma equiperdum TaxID=5694 RepID=A0A1G4HYH2_TRYEQ|nr:hypothetical protein TEOVI_000881500 [Trypanosoma equiperdum]
MQKGISDAQGFSSDAKRTDSCVYGISGATDKGSYNYGKGQDSTNACNGGSADGRSCVNYASLVKQAGGTALNKAVAWLKEIDAAEAAVLTRFTLIKKKEAEQTKMIALEDQMDELYQEALHADSENKQQPATKASTSAEPEKKKYCE